MKMLKKVTILFIISALITLLLAVGFKSSYLGAYCPPGAIDCGFDPSDRAIYTKQGLPLHFKTTTDVLNKFNDSVASSQTDINYQVLAEDYVVILVLTLILSYLSLKIYARYWH